jgi:Holliday junction DNA helicase RuvA
MIASLSGRVLEIGGDFAVVEVGGVGFSVLCPLGTLAALRPGEQTTLATSLVVREDSLTLFGFSDRDERVVFEQVQTVTGVGPKVALALLTVHAPDALRRAVMTDDLVALMKVPGMGRKSAQRLVLELKDRLGPPRGTSHGSPSAGPAADGSDHGRDWQSQVLAGLVGLGWSSRDAEEAVSAVAAERDADEVQRDLPADVAVLLKSALRQLSRA